MGDSRQLVVCCASGDRAALEPALDVLGAREFEVTVLEGARAQTPTLLEHVQRHGTGAIYVLAKSTTLHAPRIARLMTALECADVPPEHVVELDIDWRDPMALVAKIAALPTPAPIDVTQVGPAPTTAEIDQTQVGRPAPRASAPRRPGVAAGPPAAASPVAAAPLQSRAVPKTAAPMPRPPAPAPMPIAPAPLPIAPAPAPMPIAPAPAPMPIAPAAASAPVPAPQVVRPAPGTEPRPRAIDKLRVVTASLRPIARMTGGWSRRGVGWLSQSRARMLAVGGGAVALVGLVLVTTSFAGADDEPEAAEPRLVVTPLAVADDAAAVPDRAAADAPSEPPEPTILVDPEEADAKTEAPPAATPPGRRVGEHEGIVYAPLQPPKGDFEAAASQCERLNASGGAWRLPTLGELHTLTVAHVVERGVYWSITESDAFGTRALVWSEKKSRAAPIGKAWRGARALCVKDDRAPQ